MNKEKGEISVLLVGAIIALILGSLFYFSLNSKEKAIDNYQPSPSPVINSEETKTYHSKNLKFLITIPSSSDIKEGQTYTDVTIDKKLIEIMRNGTNFDSLESYLENFDNQSSLNTSNPESFTINNYEALNRLETNSKSDEKVNIYYIFVENWVYILSTSSESLYGDLDQIAKSFQYIP